MVADEKKMGETSKYDVFMKLANSVNPFFRQYSTPRLMGIFVAVLMLGGTIGLFFANYVCTDVVTLNKGYRPVYGDFITGKAFIDSFMERPAGLDDATERDANLCTYYMTNSLWTDTGTIAGTSQSFYEPATRSCILPPSDWLDAAGFPSAFKFCDLDVVPDDIKSLVQGRAGVSGMTEGVQYSPEDFFHILWDAEYPGWQCDYKTTPDGSWTNQAYSDTCSNIDSSIVYNYCGRSLVRDGSRDITWNKYSEWPSSTMTLYAHGFIYDETLTSKVCTSLTGSLGAAIGYMGYIEMLATLMVASLLVGLGIARPVHKDASISGLLKGAGLAEMAEEIEKHQIAREAKENAVAADDAHEGSELVVRPQPSGPQKAL